ncbi:site-specific integrase [Solimonas marina]|uniref:Site-specific integrase n=1 Tax=Solimonas marina TaxID=2714601 RepID=A0A970B6F4_9GAMM|nr:site-specific integrase [Solimonas marina]NKF24412.1 site-specific integrase [Solimonas marina]
MNPDHPDHSEHTIIPATDATDPVEIIASSSPAVIGPRLAASIPFFNGYAPNTRRSLMACWRIWAEFALQEGIPIFPPTLQDIERFLLVNIGKGRKRATLEQYLFAIDQLFQFAGTDNPMKAKDGRMLWKQLQNEHGLDEEQSKKQGLLLEDLERILAAAAGDEPSAIRDRALLVIAYESMTRRSEVASMVLEKLELKKDGSGAIRLGKTKTDQSGKGARLPLTVEAMKHLQAWLKLANITEGPIWRAVPARWAGKRALIKPLEGRDIARIIKRRAAQAGLNPALFAGHSTRIGAAEDLVADGASDAQVMQAGRWKSTTMVARYTKHLRDSDNAMMRFRAKRRDGESEDQT